MSDTDPIIDKPFALFDLDDTGYRGLSYMELLKWQQDQGLIPRGTLLWAQFARLRYRVGASHAQTVRSLLDIYAKALRGSDYDEVQASTNDFYRQTPNFYDYFAPTLEQLRKTHDRALVTSEPQHVAAAVNSMFGFDAVFSSEFGVYDGRFTGKVDDYLVTEADKKAASADFISVRRYLGSMALGDSDVDYGFMNNAHHAIGINSTWGLRLKAKKRLGRDEDIHSLGRNPSTDQKVDTIPPPHDWTFVSADELAAGGVLDAVSYFLDTDK